MSNKSGSGPRNWGDLGERPKDPNYRAVPNKKVHIINDIKPHFITVFQKPVAKNSGSASKSAAAPPTPLRPNNLLEAAQARLKERQRLEEESRLKASQPCADEYARFQQKAIDATARAERIRGSRIPEFDDANLLRMERKRPWDACAGWQNYN